MKKFCVITTGRTGSTSLMKALAKHVDIAVPSKQLPSDDEELLHPRESQRYRAFYVRKVGHQIATELELIDAFYDCNVEANYAGFKTMPNRHAFLQQWQSRGDVQFISLRRADVAATVASFLAARDFGLWRRDGGTHPNQLHFGQHNIQRVDNHARYIVNNEKHLDSLSRCIHLRYEELCSPSFSDPVLNEFFEREIALSDPKAPIDPASYVSNWSELKAHVERLVATLRLSA